MMSVKRDPKLPRNSHAAMDCSSLSVMCLSSQVRSEGRGGEVGVSAWPQFGRLSVVGRRRGFAVVICQRMPTSGAKRAGRAVNCADVHRSSVKTGGAASEEVR